MNGILDYMWSGLNEVAVRIAMQGPLKSYFAGVKYDVATDKFLTTTDAQLVPMLEKIFQAAPGSAAGAEAHLASWRPILDVFLRDFYRGEDYLKVSYGFLFQNIVAAYENDPQFHCCICNSLNPAYIICLNSSSEIKPT